MISLVNFQALSIAKFDVFHFTGTCLIVLKLRFVDTLRDSASFHTHRFQNIYLYSLTNYSHINSDSIIDVNFCKDHRNKIEVRILSLLRI